MATNRDPILKSCRSLDISPALLGIYKTSNRTGTRTASGRPRKMSEYALQLREKQRVKFVYGVLERPFYLAFLRARKMREGLTGENLLMLMELRLDNIVFRLGFCSARRQARQAVSHGLVLVNGKRVDIPSYRVKVGDVISVKESGRTSALFSHMADSVHTVPAWLVLDAKGLTGRVERLPRREDIDLPVNESLIVEFYSK